MKMGMIFECGPAGADKQVCEYLAARIRPGIEISSRTLDNKRNLLSDAGKVALELLKDGCCCVLILWDLRPAWPDTAGKPCRAEERLTVLARLTAAGIATTAPVYLICIEQEMESWLIANERALEGLLSTAAHQYSVPRVKRPDAVPQPKAMVPPSAKPAIPEPRAASSGTAAVQIGAVSSLSLADRAWSEAVAAAPGSGAGKGKSVEKIEKNGGTLYRTAVTGFASRAVFNPSLTKPT